MGDAVKWDEKGKRVDVCLDIGECEKATGETVSVATLVCSSQASLLLAHHTPSLEHNLRLHFNFDKTILIWTKNTSDLVQSISYIQRYSFVTSSKKSD